MLLMHCNVILPAGEKKNGFPIAQNTIMNIKWNTNGSDRNLNFAMQKKNNASQIIYHE